MKRLKFAPALVVAAVMGVTLISPMASAAPAGPGGGTESWSVGPQAKPPVLAGKVDARAEKPLGPTNLVKRDRKSRQLLAPAPRAVDDTVTTRDPINFCYGATTDIPVNNASAVAKGIRVVLTGNNEVRTLTTTARANYLTNVLFYGVHGGYTYDLYVWDGSSYEFNGSGTGSNICAVNTSAVCSRERPGFLQVNIRNLGTAFATTRTTRQRPLIPTDWDDVVPPNGDEDVIRYVRVREPFEPMDQWFVTIRVLGSVKLADDHHGYC